MKRLNRGTRRLIAAICMLAVGMLSLAVAAMADNTIADGDGVTPVAHNDVAFGDVACGVANNKSVLVDVSRNGSYSPGTQVFQKGTTATVSVAGTTGGVNASVPTSPDNEISIPGDWDTASNNTLTGDYVSATVTVNSSTPGPGAGTVTFRAAGVNPSNAAIQRDDTINVSWNTGACSTPDTTAPDITITTPADGVQYTLGQNVLANYACTDDESTVTQCDGPVANGAAIDTASVGPKSFTVNASSAGGSSSLTHNYSVVYDWTGIFQPIDNNGVFNKAKAGSAIPVKFNLGGNQGLNIFASGSPSSKKINCDASATSDPVEETVTAGQSTLTYDAAAQQYVYVWKTDKSWGGTCRQLSVALNDGTTHVANFNFTK